MVPVLGEDVKRLVKNQYSPLGHFSPEDLEQIDYKMHDLYQEFTDSRPELPAIEIVQILVYGFYIRHQPLNLRKELLREFMSTNLARLYTKMVEERRELQKEGRFP